MDLPRKVPMFCKIYGFGLIVLQVFFKGQKGQIWLIFHFDAIFSKTVYIFFLYFGMKLPKEGTDGLPKDGFDLIALKVIFQDQKEVKFWYFATFW